MASVEEARAILTEFGMPSAQCNILAGLTLIALCQLTPDASWGEAQRKSCTITKGIMDYLMDHYGTNYKPNTRESFRRQVLHQFVQGRIADLNPFNPHLSTNSPHTHYAITAEALRVIRKFGTDDWTLAVEGFGDEQGTLSQRYSREVDQDMVPLELPDGLTHHLSAGMHNILQKAVVEQFAPRFVPGGRVLYIGDAAYKDLVLERGELSDLGVYLDDHGKRPDVVLFDQERNWIFLVEAVTSHGPVSPKRAMEFDELLSACNAGKFYVSAFGGTRQFRKHLNDIAWETEVWLADSPDHLIHFDGKAQLTPRRP